MLAQASKKQSYLKPKDSIIYIYIFLIYWWFQLEIMNAD